MITAVVAAILAAGMWQAWCAPPGLGRRAVSEGDRGHYDREFHLRPDEPLEKERDPHMLEVGTEAPDFTVEDQDGNPVTLSSHRGRWVLLWWYPKAGTPG